MTMQQLLPMIEIHKGSKLPKIVFLAGFPDNQTSGWGHVLPESLASDYHLIFLCLPGYDIAGSIRPWGYSFEDIIDMMNATIESVLSSPDEKVILIGHDWGSVISYWYLAKFGSRISKFISLDVGMMDIFKLPLKDICIIIIYQTWFAISFVVSQYFGSLVGTLIMAIFFLPIFSPLWPTRGEKPHVPKETITAEKCYPYYHLWKKILSGNIPKTKLPEVPTLFMYGTDKNCMFHDERFIERLNASPQCKAVRVEKAGHWLQISQAKLVTKEIAAFLAQQQDKQESPK